MYYVFTPTDRSTCPLRWSRHSTTPVATAPQETAGTTPCTRCCPALPPTNPRSGCSAPGRARTRAQRGGQSAGHVPAREGDGCSALTLEQKMEISFGPFSALSASSWFSRFCGAGHCAHDEADPCHMGVGQMAERTQGRHECGGLGTRTRRSFSATKISSMSLRRFLFDDVAVSMFRADRGLHSPPPAASRAVSAATCASSDALLACVFQHGYSNHPACTSAPPQHRVR
jgi:hypothetical protein